MRELSIRELVNLTYALLTRNLDEKGIRELDRQLNRDHAAEARQRSKVRTEIPRVSIEELLAAAKARAEEPAAS